MSITKRLPPNTNLAQPNKFLFTLAKTPSIDYFCQKVTLPSIDVPPVDHPTPFNKLFVTGVNTNYGELVVQIVVDEELRAWQEIHDWLIGYSFPREFSQYAEQKRKGLYTDASILKFSNANVPILRWDFETVFPIRLGELEMSSTIDGNENLYLDVTFRYDTYSMTRLPNASVAA